MSAIEVKPLDKDFLRSPPGILRIAEVIVGICGLICVESTSHCFYAYASRYKFCEFVFTTSFIFALIILLIFVLQFQETLAKCMNVPLSLLINDCVTAIFYLIAAILAFAAYCYYSSYNAATKAAGVFGLLGLLCFGASAYLSYLVFRDRVPPGSTGTTTVTTVTVK